MKCYRCGERIEMPDDDETRKRLAAAEADAKSAWALVKDLQDTISDDAETKEAWAEVEELRAELRRYEPSDAVMYQWLEKRTVINEAAELLEAIKTDADNAVAAGLVSRMTEDTEGKVAAWLERHRNSWNINPRPIPEPDATIRALHTVIDEGRQLFDRAWQEDNETLERSTISHDTWAAIDEWRQRVLVKEARETVSGEVAKLQAEIDNSNVLLDAKRVERIKELPQRDIGLEILDGVREMTAAEHASYLAWIETLIVSEPKEGSAQAKVLAKLAERVEQYERNHYPIQSTDPDDDRAEAQYIRALEAENAEAVRLFEGILKAAGEHNAPWDDVDQWLTRNRKG